MPIRFTCPHCETNTVIDDALAGREGHCAVCGKPIEIPAATDEKPVDPALLQTPLENLRGKMRTHGMLLAGTAFGCVTAILLAVLVILNLLPHLREYGRQRSLQGCSENLNRINIALARYKRDHGRYPPVYSVAPDGTPLHSWRVLILQYLDPQLYHQFDLNKPWDDPENLYLAGRMPDVYRCPASDTSWDETVYQMFPAADSSSGQPTILIAEVAGKPIGWTDPNDLRPRDLLRQVGSGRAQLPQIASDHGGGAYVILTDGSIQWLDDQTPPDQLDDLLPPSSAAPPVRAPAIPGPPVPMPALPANNFP